MKIESLKIEGYKSLMNTSLQQLAKLNMLYGYNNSGKSNILKFIELVFTAKTSTGLSGMDSSNFWDGIIENASFFFNAKKNNDKISFQFKFKVTKSAIKDVLSPELYDEIVKTYFVGNNHDEIPLEIYGSLNKLNFYAAQIKLINVKINSQEFYSVDEGGNHVYLEFVTNETSKVLSENKFEVFQLIMNIFTNCVVLLDNDRYFDKEKPEFVKFDEISPRKFKRWLYTLSINPETHPIYQKLIEFIDKFKVAQKNNKALNECETNSPFNKHVLSFAQSQDELLIMFESNGRRLPISNFGTGIQQILYILAKIFSSNSKIILIEEIELNLSPKYQAEILKHLKQFIDENKISQVFFTTHSRYFNFRNDFSIYEVKIDALGETTGTKVAAAKKSFFTIRNLE